jgi:exopolyphosphatase/guanosine-5'-triphosphate,3'-diphosphate pyrophosphatase
MRVCTVDIGTNSVRALVADVKRPGQIRALHRESHITRLGEGLSMSGLLLAAAIERTAQAVAEIAANARRLGAGRFRIVATSAARDAANPDSLRARIRELASLEMEIISGLEEARYVCEGALDSLKLKGKNILMADIGGGSTELILVRRGEKPVLHSIGAGAVYITERFVHNNPPLEVELSSALEHAGALLRERCLELPPGAKELVGLGGTITTVPPIVMKMETYDPSRVHNYVFTLEHVESLLRRLGSMKVAERKKVPGLEPGREDIIIGGLVILKALLNVTGFERVRVSDRGILFGLALSLLAHGAAE